MRTAPSSFCVPQKLLVLLVLILGLHPHAYGGLLASILLFSRALLLLAFLYYKLSPPSLLLS
jgi:hypothetical protein